MKQLLIIILSFCFIFVCPSKKEATNHIFYLHGRILEIQGINAVSEQFGIYKYEAILDSLKSTGAIIHAEVRTENTDFQAFCEKISKQIDSLIQRGIATEKIVLVGASKGAIMAMNISNMNPHPIKYILLGANNDYIEAENEWNLQGKILGIYEKSDSLAGKNYDYWIDKSTRATAFKQIRINTGLGHGFLYQAVPEWLNPVKEWIKE